MITEFKDVCNYLSHPLRPLLVRPCSGWAGQHRQQTQSVGADFLPEVKGKSNILRCERCSQAKPRGTSSPLHLNNLILTLPNVGLLGGLSWCSKAVRICGAFMTHTLVSSDVGDLDNLC